MKSLASHLESSRARRGFAPRLPVTEFDDEPTGVLDTLGALVTAPAIAVDQATPLDEVRRLLAEQRVPALAVVDDDHALRGVITRTDVLRALDGAGATAGDAMSSFVFALPSYASIEKAAALIAFEGVGQVVVTGADGELVGMVSAIDIARHYAIEAGYLVA